MKKIYTLMMMAMMATTAFAQEANDTTYVMLDFNQNPWGYPASEVTKGWAPDYGDWDSPGAILKDKDFSWPIADGSAGKVKVTVTAVDLDEFEKVSVYAGYELGEADVASLGIPAGKTNMLYTQPGTTMRFEAPDGYKFGKMVFYNFRSSNFLVGDEYDETFAYVYDNNTFTNNLKVWTPASPNKNSYGSQMWDGDAKNVLFNYPYFSAVFVKIDIRLLSDGTSGIKEVGRQPTTASPAYSLDGRAVDGSKALRKGIYITDGKKRLVK